VPVVANVLGMAPPPLGQLAVLPLFAVLVWGVDEVARAVRRHTPPKTPSGRCLARR
jgi:hypothetical protein